VKLTCYGRSTWPITVDGTIFLTDSYFDWPYPNFQPADLPPPNYVLVTQAHWSRIKDLDEFTESTVLANTDLVIYISLDYELAGAHVMNLGRTVNAGDAQVLMHCTEHAHGVKCGSFVDTPHEENAKSVGLAVGYVVSDVEPKNREAPGAEACLTGDTQLLSEMRDFVAPYLGPKIICVSVVETTDVGRSTRSSWQAAITVDWLGVDYVCPMLAPDARDAGTRFRSELSELECGAAVVDLDHGEMYNLAAALATQSSLIP